MQSVNLEEFLDALEDGMYEELFVTHEQIDVDKIYVCVPIDYLVPHFLPTIEYDTSYTGQQFFHKYIAYVRKQSNGKFDVNIPCVRYQETDADFSNIFLSTEAYQVTRLIFLHHLSSVPDFFIPKPKPQMYYMLLPIEEHEKNNRNDWLRNHKKQKIKLFKKGTPQQKALLQFIPEMTLRSMCWHDSITVCEALEEFACQKNVINNDQTMKHE
jgi:hypothetical protein